MGMDVSGLNPTCEDGEYFRANIWSWRVIHVLIDEANRRAAGKLVSSKAMAAMSCNDGAGVKSEEKCRRLADIIEKMLNDRKIMEDEIGFVFFKLRQKTLGKGGVVVKDEEVEEFGFPITEHTMAVHKDTGCFADMKDVKAGKVKLEDLRPAHSTTIEHAREFVKFLRNCGGFAVY